MRREPSPETDLVAHNVIGAAIEVHRALGPGFLEAVYEEALCLELAHRALPFTRQVPLSIHYRGYLVGQARIDILVADQLIVELKAIDGIAPIHIAQILSYLRATSLSLGLVINFNVPALRLGIKRVLNPAPT